MPRLNRLFFALVPDDAAQRAMTDAAHRLAVRLQPGGRPVAGARLHLTLAFLGDAVPAAQEEAARSAATTVAALPFDLTLDQAASFAGRSAPWWLGPREMPAALERLHRALQDALLRSRVPMDRKRFVPHVTVRRDARMHLAPTRIVPVTWSVQHFCLLRSALDGPASAAYQELARWPLLPAPDLRQQLELLG